MMLQHDRPITVISIPKAIIMKLARSLTSTSFKVTVQSDGLMYLEAFKSHLRIDMGTTWTGVSRYYCNMNNFPRAVQVSVTCSNINVLSNAICTVLTSVNVCIIASQYAIFRQKIEANLKWYIIILVTITM